MSITSTELLQAGSLAVAALAIWATSRNSRRSERFQQWNAAAARLEERRVAVYQEILIDMDRADRGQRRFSVEGFTGGAESPADEVADQDAARKARVDMFASDAVKAAWTTWLDVFSEGWVLLDEMRRGGGVGTGQLAEDFSKWEHAVHDAHSAVAARMREECGRTPELASRPMWRRLAALVRRPH